MHEKPPCYTFGLFDGSIISYKHKIRVKFLILTLTQILCSPCYSEGTKERGDLIGSIEKSFASVCIDRRRCSNDLFRSLARRGGHRARQGDQAVFGVYRNWIGKKLIIRKRAYQGFCHAFGA